MKRYVTARWLNNEVLFDMDLLKHYCNVMFKNGQSFLIAVERKKRYKTLPQLRAFHGPICEQVQAYYKETEGIFKSLDRVKEELKAEHLVKKKQYYDDGTPVMVKIEHPTKKGVNFYWHMEQVPSLSDLTIEEMTDFIERIIEDFYHKKNYLITLNSYDEIT